MQTAGGGVRILTTGQQSVRAGRYFVTGDDNVLIAPSRLDQSEYCFGMCSCRVSGQPTHDLSGFHSRDKGHYRQALRTQWPAIKARRMVFSLAVKRSRSRLQSCRKWGVARVSFACKVDSSKLIALQYPDVIRSRECSLVRAIAVAHPSPDT